MHRSMTGIAVGVILLGAGVLLLLDALHVIGGSEVFWAMLFSLAGFVFVWLFVRDERAWWAAVPAGSLIGLAGSMLSDTMTGRDEAGGAFFLGFLGLAFAAIYLRNRVQWWAIIPTGVLLTLAAQTAVTPIIGEAAGGSFLLLGLAMTFALVALLPGGAHHRRWAWISAGVLAALGIVIALGADCVLASLNYLWPLALLVAGAFLIWRTATRGRTAPPRPQPGESIPPVVPPGPLPRRRWESAGGHGYRPDHSRPPREEPLPPENQGQ